MQSLFRKFIPYFRLWRRKSTVVINIGRVDRLGRYYSQYEVPPVNPNDDRVSSKLSKAVIRMAKISVGGLIGSGGPGFDRIQEEMAWQTAEMIVSEITALTSPPKWEESRWEDPMMMRTATPFYEAEGFGFEDNDNGSKMASAGNMVMSRSSNNVSFEIESSAASVDCDTQN